MTGVVDELTTFMRQQRRRIRRFLADDRTCEPPVDGTNDASEVDDLTRFAYTRRETISASGAVLPCRKTSRV